MAENALLSAIGNAVDKMGAVFRKPAPQEADQEQYKEIIDEAERFYAKSLIAQKPYHKVWYTNIAYFVGLQWVDWQSSSNWLYEPAAPSWRVRIVANYIMPTIITKAAKILRSNPNMRVVPANDSDEARGGAKAGDRLMESKYYEDEFQRKIYSLVMWFLTSGVSFLWSIWDGTYGRRWTEPVKNPDGTPQLDDLGNPVEQAIYEGDNIFDVSGPFEVMLEPGAPEDFNEHTKVMRIKIRKSKDIKERYGVDVGKQDLHGDTQYNLRISGMVGSPSINSSIESAIKDEDMVLFKEYFELPTTKYPEGRHFCYANGKMLVPPEPLDYWYMGKRALPCAKFGDITVPGRVYDMGITEQIGPLNVLYNKIISGVVETQNLLSKPKVLAPVGCLAQDSFTSEPGEIVEYQPIASMKPEAWKPPEIPQYIFQLLALIPQIMDNISGVHDQDRGKLPRRATSGVAIGLLNEADDTITNMTVRNFASSLSRVMSIALKTYGDKYRESRLVKKIGQNHRTEIFQFKGADLAGADTVRCEMATTMGRGARIQMAMEMAKEGLIPKEILARIIESGDLNMAFDRNAGDVNYAQVENFGMAKGLMYEPGQFEDHDAHMFEHKQFLNSDVGHKLDPAVKSFFEEHVKKHEMIKQAALVEARTPMAPPPGPVPGLPPGNLGEPVL